MKLGFFRSKPKIAYFVCCLAFFILAQIVYHQPFLGLMDDSTNYFWIVPTIKKMGLIPFTLKYLQRDRVWGMFRPVYPPMVYILYGIAHVAGPVAYYLVNAIFVLGILYFHAYVLAKIIKINHWHILLAVFAFPYTYDLFQHPSLQEKLILLFGSGLLLVSYLELNFLLKIALMTFFLILGCGSKASFILFIPLGFIAFSASVRRFLFPKKIKLFICVIGLFSVAALFLIYITLTGGYTSHYERSKILDNLLSIQAIFFLAIVGFSSIFLLRINRIKTRYEEFIPMLGVLGFVILFLPWGLSGYLLSLVSVLLAALVIQVATILSPKLKIPWVPILASISILVAYVKPHAMFSRLHDLRIILNMSQSLEQQHIEKIYMYCNEGSESMDNYFQHIKNSTVRVEALTDLQPRDTKIILYDSAMCPLPVEKLWKKICVTDILYQSNFGKGYRLVKFSCHS